MIKIFNESVKGPIISWENYLTDVELLSLFLHLNLPETVLKKVIDDGRLTITDNKTFDDVLDELNVWIENRRNNPDLLNEKVLSKENRYYYDMRDTVENAIKSNPNAELSLGTEYWDEEESLGTYRRLKKLVESKLKNLDVDLDIGICSKEKYDLEKKINEIILEYVNTRIKILSKPLIKPEDKIVTEKSRTDILSKSKSQSPGRWERRQYYKNFNVVKTDIRDLDDKDTVVVEFEVGDYKVLVSFSNILLNLRQIVKQDPKHMVKFDWVIRACNRALDQADIYVNCQCADFRYRMKYWASRNKYVYGKRELRPADITNPNDDKGSVCKHLLSVLSNKNWMTKVATVVNDWLQMKDVYEIRELLNYDEANMPTEISRELGKMSARAKGIR